MVNWLSKCEAYLAFLLSGTVSSVLFVLQEGIVDQADGVLHYQFAKFVFDHPENVFDHWAKPLFTTIMALPAQMGLNGVKMMNVFFIAMTALLIAKTAVHFNLKGAWLIGIFAGIGNAITYVVLGGLTEPLFMLVFAGVIYSASMQKWPWMYFLLGASLLARPESIVIVPVFGLYGLLKGHFKYALWGFAVPLIFTIGGMLIADYNWHWIISNQPYGHVSQPYGHGDWVHYLHQWHRVSPWVVLLLAALSIVSILKEKRVIQLFIFIASFGIVALHVLLWKYGSMGSAGLSRVLATSLPGLALCAGFTLTDLLPIPKYSIVVFAVVFGIQAYENNSFPVEVDGGQYAAEQISEELKERGISWKTAKVSYQFAAVAYHMDLDPFDLDRTQRFWSLRTEAQPSGTLKNGDLLIWDNMTGPREGRMTWDRVDTDPNLVQLDSVSVRGKTLVSFVVQK